MYNVFKYVFPKPNIWFVSLLIQSVSEFINSRLQENLYAIENQVYQ